MKMIIISDYQDGGNRVVEIKTFGFNRPTKAVEEIHNFLTRDIPAKTFELVMKKLRQGGHLQ